MLLNKRSGPLLEADSNPSDDNSQQLVSNIRPSNHGEVRFQLQPVCGSTRVILFQEPFQLRKFALELGGGYGRIW